MTTEEQTLDENVRFPIATGEMAEIYRLHDWSSTALGPMQSWPETLKVLVENLLNNPFPIGISWGPMLCTLYNDAYSVLLADKHPDVLGGPVREVWPEVWHQVEPLLNIIVETGESVWQEDSKFLINRQDGLEESYFTFSFSPVYAGGPEVAGIQVTAAETTEHVLSRRRLATIRSISEEGLHSTVPQESLRTAAESLAGNPADIPFVLIYLDDGSNPNLDGRIPLLKAVGVPPELLGLPEEITEQTPFGLANLTENGAVVDLQSGNDNLKDHFSGHPPAKVLVLPITIRGPHAARVRGYYIFGLSPLLRYNDHYLEFLREVATALSTTYGTLLASQAQLQLANARAELLQRKVENRQLRELAHLLESIDEPFYALDRQWRLIYFNEAARNDSAWTKSDILEKSFWESFPHVKGTRVEGAFRMAMETGESQTAECQSPNGRYYLVRAYPWENGLSVSFRDVTSRKSFEAEQIAARERAEEMTRLKSTLLANMSHEIRTPLTSIIGMASVLSRQVPPEYQDQTEHIERAGKRLARTLDSVLTLAQLEGAAFETKLDTINLNADARDAVRSLNQLAAAKGLDLEIITPEKPVLICTDQAHISGIFNNLIGNAIKFTTEGCILVHVIAEEDRAILRIEDSGIGIKEEFLPHIFDEFRQESTGISRSHGGVGLGLAITKRMVDVIGATISVFSTPGGGTTFTLTFPLADNQSVSPTAISGQLERPPAGNERRSLLVVEDDHAILAVLKTFLSENFDLTTATDGETALRKAGEQIFDAIILDIGLPGMSGLEALHQLRSMEPYKESPIIAISGYAMPDDRCRFIDEGFTDHIAKPFVPEDLQRRISELL